MVGFTYKVLAIVLRDIVLCPPAAVYHAGVSLLGVGITSGGKSAIHPPTRHLLN
jgi:hypothetical protein